MSDEQSSTLDKAQKSRGYIILEGSLYVLISAIPPAIQVLQSTEPLTTRSLTVMGLACLVAGATALKAFLSQSLSPKQ